MAEALMDKVMHIANACQCYAVQNDTDYPVVFPFVYYTIPGKMRKSFSLPLVNSG